MVLLEVRKLIADRRGDFSHLGETITRSFPTEERASAWLDWEDSRGIANWEKYELMGMKIR